MTLDKKKRGKNKRPLLPGEIFHNLTVVEYYGKNKDAKHTYLCICTCGKTCIVRHYYLLNGRTKSCGCQNVIAIANTGRKYIHMALKTRRQFVGDLCGALWNRILFNAKCRNLNVTITKEYVWELFVKQNKKCALTGTELFLSPHHIDRTKVTASLDRIDSKRGYIEGNVQWVHKDVNRMRNNFDIKYFKEVCKQVIDYDSATIK